MELIYTPKEIIQAVAGFSSDVPDALILGTLEAQFPPTNEGRILFHDSDFTSSFDGVDAAELDQRLEAVRARMQAFLSARGYGVIRVKQMSDPAGNPEGKLWRPLATNPGLCVAVGGKSRTPKVIEPEVTGSHPFLSPEFTQEMDDGTHVTVALNYYGKPTLHDLIDEIPIETLIPILVDAMEACAAFHKEGRVHGDVKPENIFGKPHDSDEYGGRLFDFEGWTPNGDEITVSTRKYDESTYLKNESAKRRGDKYFDIASFGLILLEIYAGKEALAALDDYMHAPQQISVDIDNDSDSDDCCCSSFGFAQPTDFRFIKYLEDHYFTNAIPSQVQDLLRRIFQLNRRARPDLPEIIGVLKNLYPRSPQGV
ncbi:MAG: hypothetical protein WCW30_01405 [Candidatus Gracilibacteria bacterium]